MCGYTSLMPADDTPTVIHDPVINDAADRILGRIILRHGALTFALLVFAPFVMWFVNLPGTPLYADRRFLDTVSVFVILLPFFVGTNRLFAARLAIGRELAQAGRWREAVAALDPFAGMGQRFLDPTGEAHFWLARAYAGQGETAKAKGAGEFVRRYRPGVWAQKLEEPQEKTARAANRAGGKKQTRSRF